MLTPLYIIPARGGSKGIPRKNIKLLGGRPLIDYAIAEARAAGADDSHIILSTDDAEIAQVARDFSRLAVDYMRPAELATDTAGSREVIIDAMDYADSQGIAYDCVVLLQPTSPLRTAADIVAAVELFAQHRPDMVVSVVEATSNPYYNCFETDPDSGFLHISKGDGLYTRRQDAPKAWEYNGAVYVIDPQAIRRWPLGKFPRRMPIEMPRSRSIDLDTPTDWLVAEALIAQLNDK